MYRFYRLLHLPQRNKNLIIIFPLFIIAASSSLRCTNDPCMYGICLDDRNSSYSCYCIDGYTGINCEINWDDCWSNPCLNGGTCNDAVAAYNCTCTEGFIGVNCEQKFSECVNQPCLNNGTCFDYNGFMCQCPEGYSGDYCEIDASVCNNTICKHAGECIEGPGFSFSCRCIEGWTGELCEEDIDECITSPCQNGGLCINAPATYTCACLFGFTGKNCDKEIVPCERNPCKNNAVCLLEDTQPVCYCVPDYHGSLCELRYNDCESKFAQCENGGTCIDGINNFTCACLPRYSGETCSEYESTLSTDLYPDLYTQTSSISVSTTYLDRTSPSSVTSSHVTDISTSTFFAIVSDGKSEASSAATTVSSSTKSGTFPDGRTDLSKVSTPPTAPTQRSTTPTDHVTETSTGYSFVSSFTPTTEAYSSTHPATFTSNASMTKTTISYTISPIPAQTTAPGERSSPTSSEVPLIPVNETTITSSLKTTSPASVASKEVTFLPSERTTLKTDIDVNETWTRTPPSGEVTTTSAATIFANETVVTIPDVEVKTNRSTSRETTFYTTLLGATSSPTISVMPTAGSTYTPSKSTVVDVGPPSITPSISVTSSTERSYTMTTTGYTSSSEAGGQLTTEGGILQPSCPPQQCPNATVCTNATECTCNCKGFENITNAAFNGKSYIKQQVFVDDKGMLKILVGLRTLSKGGIVVHTFFDNERYILLYLEAGLLKFQFSCGFQTMLLGEIDSPINNGHNVDMEVRFQFLFEHRVNKCSAMLLINNTVAMSGEQIVTIHDMFPRQAWLHLGGIPLTFSHYFPHVAMGFVGCMNLLKINNNQKHLIHDSTETFQIEECTSLVCLSNPCRNFGACQEVNGKVHCTCIAGYTGELCERSICDINPCHLGATCISSPGTGFICVCPFGMHGLLCEEDFVIMQPSFTVFVPGFSSYVAYGLTNSIKNNMELKMRLIPHSLEQISLIAYMGQSGSRRELSDHFSITYVRGYIMVTWDLGSGVRRIFTNTPLTAKAHRPHTLRVGRRGRDTWLSVDGLGNVTGRTAGAMTQLDVSPVLYIGGHKVKNFETLPHDLPLHTGFFGCIFDVELRADNTIYPVTQSSPATGRGVGECHHNECTHRSCKNGAVCLNHGPSYSCICTKDWQGADCSTKTTVLCPSSSPHCQENS